MSDEYNVPVDANPTVESTSIMVEEVETLFSIFVTGFGLN
jgi:hypothetical protein